jgi:superfamily II DNA/RNA helicase
MPDALHQRLEASGFARPTEIQQRAITPVLDGQHVAIHSPTGTGKTIAFFAPAIARLAVDARARSQPRAGGVELMVVAPSVELAIQLGAVLAQLLDQPPLVLAQDGVDEVEAQRRTYDRFVAARRASPQAVSATGVPSASQPPPLREPIVVVGTAKRLLEVLGRSERRWEELARSLSCLVLDEVDLLLPPLLPPSLPSLLPASAAASFAGGRGGDVRRDVRGRPSCTRIITSRQISAGSPPPVTPFSGVLSS